MCSDQSCGMCEKCKRLAREAYGESDPFVYYWPDGAWCWPEDLEEMVMAPCAKSDDFAVLEVGHLDGDEEVELKVTEKVNNMHK